MSSAACRTCQSRSPRARSSAASTSGPVERGEGEHRPAPDGRAVGGGRQHRRQAGGVADRRRAPPPRPRGTAGRRGRSTTAARTVDDAGLGRLPLARRPRGRLDHPGVVVGQDRPPARAASSPGRVGAQLGGPGPHGRGRGRPARRPGRPPCSPPARASAPSAVARTAGDGSPRKRRAAATSPRCPAMAASRRRATSSATLRGTVASRGRERLTTADDRRRREPRSRQEQAATTRRQLLDAAGAVFEERGYKGTTVGAITDRANTAHGTFYLYFRNKEDAFCQVIESVIVDELAVESSSRLDEPRGRRSRRASAPSWASTQARRPVAGAARGHAAVAPGAAAVARPAPRPGDPPVGGVRRPAARGAGARVRHDDGGALAGGDDRVVGVHPPGAGRAHARPAARPRGARRDADRPLVPRRSSARSTGEHPG